MEGGGRGGVDGWVWVSTEMTLTFFFFKDTTKNPEEVTKKPVASEEEREREGRERERERESGARKPMEG